MKPQFITFSLIALAITTGCSKPSGDSNVPAQPVKTCTPVVAGSDSYLVFPGKVVSDDKVYTSFKVAGRIASINVKEGDYVKAGQMIGALDDTDYRVALDAAEAEYNSVNSEAQRIIAIYNENATTSAAYDKAVYGLQQITAKLNNARNQLNDTRLKAPSSGVVKAILRHAGEVVGAGTPVLEIINNDSPLVEIKLPASAFTRLNEFRNFSCTFDVFPGKTFTLKPFAEQSVANANQLYTVKLAFADTPEQMPSVGMTTTVTIQTGSPDNSSTDKLWIVPSTALVGNDNSSYIYTITPDSIIHKTGVEVIRLTLDGNAEISAPALTTESRIVAAGAGKLRDNMKVSPLAPASSTNVGNQL